MVKSSLKFESKEIQYETKTKINLENDLGVKGHLLNLSISTDTKAFRFDSKVKPS